MIKINKVLYKEIFSPPMMSFFVISACNLQCKECIMLSQMKLHSAYQMSLEEMEKFIYYTEKSGYFFNYRYTGGEPLYWKNLEEGTRMLRKSKSCKSILLMTNAMKHDNITDNIINMIDYVRISKYEYNHDAIKILKDKYPEKVMVVDREDFYPNPKEPLENSLPVDCGNPEHLYFNNKIFACPHSYSLAIKNGLTHLELGVDIGMDYCKRNREIRDGHEKICTLCLGNKKVRNQIEKEHNFSNHHSSLIQLTIRRKT